MRIAFKYSSASKTVVEELAELGYLKSKHGLTNKMVRLFLVAANDTFAAGTVSLMALSNRPASRNCGR